MKRIRSAGGMSFQCCLGAQNTVRSFLSWWQQEWKPEHLTLPPASILIAILGTEEFAEAPKPASPVSRLLQGPPEIPQVEAAQRYLGQDTLTLVLSDTKLLVHTSKVSSLTTLKHVNVQFHSLVLSLKKRMAIIPLLKGVRKPSTLCSGGREDWRKEWIQAKKQTQKRVMGGETGRRRQPKLGEKSFCPEI